MLVFSSFKACSISFYYDILTKLKKSIPLTTAKFFSFNTFNYWIYLLYWTEQLQSSKTVDLNLFAKIEKFSIFFTIIAVFAIHA